MNCLGTIPRRPPGRRTASGMLLDYQHFREEIADEWTRRQAAAIKSADPAALVTVGMIQWSVPALLPGVRTLRGLPARSDRRSCWTSSKSTSTRLAAGFFEYRAEDEERNLAYLESVVREVAAAGQPVVVAEFGWYGGGKLTIDDGRHPPASEEAAGALVPPRGRDHAPVGDRLAQLGLLRPPPGARRQPIDRPLDRGRPAQSLARAFHKLVQSLGAGVGTPRALGPRPALDWDRAITDQKAAEQFRAEYFKAFQMQR